MARTPQDQLIRKETLLGLIRERQFPEGHIGLRLFAPFQDVTSDDVIFDYVQESADGLAPARAEDAESEMAQKEDTLGEGRASIIDWAIKDHYTSSDVTRYQEAIYTIGRLGTDIPRSIGLVREDFNRRVARDTVLRRRKLDNRLEWLIQEALWKGAIAYNDGKIVFNVTYGRPTDQTNASVATPWTLDASDPIKDILAVKEYMRDTHGVIIDRALTSEKVLLNILNSSKFAQRANLAATANPAITPDPFYTIDGWGAEAARNVVQRATGVTFLPPYDSVFNTRAPAATTRTQNRFSPEDKILFLPNPSSVAELDGLIGFGKTLTSPHPEGNFTPGYYAWEKDTGPDPWGHDFGNGVKAFPVFPHLKMTYVLKVI